VSVPTNAPKGVIYRVDLAANQRRETVIAFQEPICTSALGLNFDTINRE
jgi:hypothetical protein